MSHNTASAPHKGSLFVRPLKNKAIPIIKPPNVSLVESIDIGTAPQLFGNADLRSVHIQRHITNSNLSSSTISNHLASDRSKDAQDSQDANFNIQTWKANIYARPYVPKSLTDINLLPATVVSCTPLADINFQDYVSTFAGSQYLVPHLPMKSLATKPLKPVTFSLAVQSYKEYFEAALDNEFGAEADAIISYYMYKVQLRCRDLKEQLYELEIPGLREDIPKVDLGDTVLLRQLRLNQGTVVPPGIDTWLSTGYDRDPSFPAPGFTGFEFNVSVWGIDKTKERIVLKIAGHLEWPLIFNVMFSVQEKRYEPFQRAVNDIGYQLDCTNAVYSSTRSTLGHFVKHPVRDDTSNISRTRRSAEIGDDEIVDNNELEQNISSSTNTWMRRMLFPNISNGVKQEGLPKGALTQNWFDDALNYEQQKAVDAIQTQNYGSIPFLISGPPGTGKTKTVVEAALQFVYSTPSPRKHILLCAPSNPAADTLALRIKAAIPDQDLYNDLFRLNSSSRSFAEVPEELLPYCHINNNQFSLPEFRKLMSYKLIITTCRDADILVKARVTNRDLVTLEKGIIDAIHFGSNTADIKVPLHWNALLIDEAAQATEPEAGVPLTVVTPPENGSIGSVIIVMAGDQHQLGPRLLSQETYLSTSLFERLIERPVYADHPLARRQASSQNSKSSSKPTFPIIHPPFTNLFRNYRSHASILAIPSALFYADTLLPCATDTSALSTWSHWRGRRWPVLFVHNRPGGDERDLAGWGWTNNREVTLACTLAQSLVTEGLLAERDICIMSPFRAQVARLRSAMRAPPYGLRAVNIGPVEAFQGLESRCVILCTTRTQRRYWEEEDRVLGLGVIGEAKRFNVAVTRARQGLVVIGNPGLLQRDEAWKVFLGFCWRHGLWEDGEEGKRRQGKESEEDHWAPSDEATPSYTSSLERGLVYEEELGGRLSLGARWPSFANEEDAMWVSGQAAEDVLREH